MTTYVEALKIGERRYETAISALRATGFPTEFTQTGGMCAALEVTLERGTLLVTDAGDELPWSPSAQRGWGVGFYASSDVSDGPIVYVEDESDISPGRLVELVVECMREYRATAV